MQIRSTRASNLPSEHAVASHSPVLQRTAQPAAVPENTVRAGQVARRLGVTPLVVEQLRQAQRLLAVPCEHGFAYPSWQFEGRGMLSGFPTVLGALRGYEPHRQLAFFLTSQPGLNGQTPLDALRAGEIEAVLQITRT